MIAVDCPRCGRTWYSEEDHAGRVRLCSDCADELRHNRRRYRLHWDAFTFTALGLFVLDVQLIVLGAVLPDLFGMVLLVYGLVLLVPAGLFLAVSLQAYWYMTDADWDLLRWPVLVAAMGLACVAAYFALVLPGR
jgi:hypothetical protein